MCVLTQDLFVNVHVDWKVLLELLIFKALISVRLTDPYVEIGKRAVELVFGGVATLQLVEGLLPRVMHLNAFNLFFNSRLLGLALLNLFENEREVV